uniref:Glycosyltransferase 2-like domain-containing protein n=1 Tax=viral metagenome TaxID=1070528 RepID=A0A6C0B0D2_9ZZZZ
MKIGVAVPCYIGHVDMLYDLLDSIESQTLLPDKVVVSCSSTSDFSLQKNYRFPIEVITTHEKKNAAQNRNIAVANLKDMDYINFIDADDIMHKQRIEFIKKVIKENSSDIVFHNYFMQDPINKLKITELYESVDMKVNTLTQCSSGCIRHINFHNNSDNKIHHSQITVKREIFEQVLFPEEECYKRKEDCVFCHRVFGLPNINHVYIENNLSYYRPSGTMQETS